MLFVWLPIISSNSIAMALVNKALIGCQQWRMMVKKSVCKSEWPPISFKSWTGKPLGSDDVPDLKESNLIISILRTDSANHHYSSFNSNHFSICSSSLPLQSQVVHEEGWVCVPASVCVFCICARERKTCVDVYLRGQDNNVSPLLLV